LAFDGTDYEIDLASTNPAVFRKQLAAFIKDAARSRRPAPCSTLVIRFLWVEHAHRLTMVAEPSAAPIGGSMCAGADRR
jgi:hypothetical protein